MRVVAVLSTCAVSSFSIRPKVLLLSPRRKHLSHHACTLLSKSDRRGRSTVCSIRTQAAEHSDHSFNLSTDLNTVADDPWDTSTEKSKEFPRKRAKSVIAERLLILGQETLKWSLAFLFGISFLSDVFMALAGNRELMIPLGLFAGVILADFLKESSQEFFLTNIKDESFPKQLLGVGSLFVFIKLLSLCFSVQGRTFLSHIGNGGLMQVLWLAQQHQGVNVERQEEETDTW